MDNTEQIAFDIISNTGEARSILMNLIAEAEKENFSQVDEQLKLANDCLKAAQKTHLKLLSDDAQQNGEASSMNALLVHAEDQMMAAELIRDLTIHLVHLNQKVAELSNK
ncbi:PTS lactose/cellobiose transporter subunit IIA [Bombilactobacillus folatiphilus]|uniref:PTS lactose/cellobiose transporter subunit IIA n=1 Tax=Bombilactobacillus folatiphilus TaxID=2923362 RepID=A0ABY4P7F5_9LACO|nr:PTS lactose/cellobiose transporter subunit IIA [Bombilactobacillus folatiphilus]UQS81459.1 PTS lactose/cellobiose transporter subunit IIA [Bombilactobacillus folatiphilus]